MRPIFPNYSYDGSVYNYGGNFSVSAAVGNVNYLQAVGALAGNPPSLQAMGIDANIGVNFIAKGNGAYLFNGNTQVTQFGSLRIGVAGQGLLVRSGAGAKIGQSVLVAGTVTVANANVTVNSRIFVTVSAPSGTPGFISVSKSVGVSFTITSTMATDTCTVDWFIVESI